MPRRMASALGRSLKTRPFLTNAAMSGVVIVLGDLAAQAIERRRKEAEARAEALLPAAAEVSPADGMAGAIEATSRAVEAGRVDLKRTASMAVWGAGTSPLVVHWFRWLDRVFPPANTTPRGILSKVMFNQLTMAPVMNALFFGYVMAVNNMPAPPAEVARKTAPQWAAKVRGELVPTTVKSLGFWIPVHVVNFVWVPPHARVLYTSCGLVAWTTYLSIVGHR